MQRSSLIFHKNRPLRFQELATSIFMLKFLIFILENTVGRVIMTYGPGSIFPKIDFLTLRVAIFMVTIMIWILEPPERI